MPTPSRHDKVFARAALVAAVLAAAPLNVCAQDRMSAEARVWQHETAQARRVEANARWQLERARAHARMPSTMYASTPDPAPPHAFPLASPSAGPVERPSAPPPAPSSAASVERTHRIALFPSAARGSEGGYQGLVRIINHSEEAGEVHIDAFDDEGDAHGPVTLRIEAGESAHFTSEDLERGNPAKGLEGATGTGEGDWRLELTSDLALEVLAYARSRDGFLTAVHDLVPPGAKGYRVALFLPASDPSHVSRLRLVNPGAETAQVRIEGIDDTGASAVGAVRLEVPAGAVRTVSAHELESGGTGLSGALGPGKGKWRLMVHSDQPIDVMNLLSSPTGHLANFSSSPRNAVPDEVGALTTHTVPLLPAASRFVEEGLQGFVRVINHAREAGEVRIEAFDDGGTPAGPVTLAIGAGEAVHLSAADLELGNIDTGLSGGVGTGEGGWRLVLTSALELEVRAYLQTDDGFLAAVHDLSPRSGAGYRVALFGPASTMSRLRLVNPGSEPAAARIEGIDDRGASPGGSVRLEVPPRGARTLTARQLEAGEGVDGALGDGEGRWRLLVNADRPLQVMSLLSSPAGHLANLSTAPGPVVAGGRLAPRPPPGDGDEESAAGVFAEDVSSPIVQAKCVNCHVQGGIAGATRLHFVPASDPGHEARNLQVFTDFLDGIEDGANLVLNKVQGVGHGGGVQLAAGTAEFSNIERFLTLLGEEAIAPVVLTPHTLFDTVQMAPARKTLRRAALIFAGRLPTDEEYAAIRGGPAALRAALRGLMTGPEFHEFLIRGANDRLLTDKSAGEAPINLESDVQFVDAINEHYRRKKPAYDSGDARKRRDFWDWVWNVQYGVRRAPLELIAHVVENDRPYTESLTANYVMANPPAAAAYGARTQFDDPGDVHEFKPSRIVEYYRQGEEFRYESDPHLMATRILDPGSLKTVYPHAGALNTKIFLHRYPTTATNRNRARSRWTYYHFLGLDIEKSASRTTDPVALADTNNPTMRNPACTVCHRLLDPVAGAFQNYGDEGLYRDQWGGLDSLDGHYKAAIGEEREIRADTWKDRETLSWPVWLDAGIENLRVVYTNHFYDESTGFGGNVYLDRMRVKDERGGVVANIEFENLDMPVTHWGTCARLENNPATGREDHVSHWGGSTDCSFSMEVEIPTGGLYQIEVVAWAIGKYEQYGGNGFAKLAVDANAYRKGDTWYRDMRTPGFAGELAPNPDNSVQWLARQIVADERFAEAAVKFWWPAIMGSEVAEPPADEGDADFEGLLLASNAQGAEVARLARGFRHGFRGGAAYNLKDLLVEIVLSKWFRADAVEDADPVRRVALRDAGARRLLTPEELARKTAALTGVQWKREILIGGAYRGQWSALRNEYRLLYGGIDSDGVTTRARDLTSVMAGVAKRNAARVSCAVVTRDFFLVPEEERQLFTGIDPDTTPGLEFGDSFEIEAGSRDDRETLSMTGPLTAGSKTVQMTFTNEYWGGSNSADRNVHLDRLDVRDSAGEVVASLELEELPSPEDCRSRNGDNFALWCNASVEVPIDLPAGGEHTIEVVAWADQAGDELARLTVAVEDADGSGAGDVAIRNKLVELHESLLGVEVTPHSPDVEAAWQLFVDEMARTREAQDNEFNPWECDWAWDHSFFEGILDGALKENEDSETGWRWYNWDWDRLGEFFESKDWSDHYHTAQAWTVVLAYLLGDYRYLYL